MHNSVREFLKRTSFPVGRLCELGSYNVNGTARDFWTAEYYLGIDIRPGPCVDVVADVSNGCLDVLSGRFDVVLSTETLEHVRNWKAFLHRCKLFLKPGGMLVLTARGPGFPRHGHPNDFWRFSTALMRQCLSDMEAVVEDDPQKRHPGFFAVAIKPPGWIGCDLPDAEPVKRR